MEDNPSIFSKAFIPDDPEVERDDFKRKPFAQRISTTIVSRREPSSIVIGIYGKWGEGKTTVLNFIENELKKHENIICIRYNPWYYSNEAMLLQDFFDVLAEELEKVDSSNNLKTQIKKYGKHISQFATSKSATVNLGPLRFNPFSSDSFLNLAESKKEIQAILKKCNVRIVVLMDDIDRLDKTEIQSIFKLVKLSADFYYLDYILAFDEEMVASAIGEKYGSNDIESGRNFLEKIINVPLHLPQIGETALFYYLRDGIDNNVLPIIKHRLEKEEYEIFFEQFKKGIQIKLKTPRMAKRYQNALIFALPILKDEVNILDLMLIEGIRVFYPKMYDVIKNNAEVFLIPKSSLFKTDLEKIPNKINVGFENLSIKEKESLKDLLCYLFPESQHFLNDIYSDYPIKNQQSLTRKRRIASLRYFNRYFSYAVPAGDISDLEIEDLIESINRTENIDDREIEGISSQIIELIMANGPGSADSFISKIYRIKNKLNLKTSQKLALAISNLSDSFPESSDLYLLSDLLQTMPLTTRIACSKKMISARSICFALNIYYIIKRKEIQILAEDIEHLKYVINNRISNEIISESEPIYVRYPCGGSILRFLQDSNYKDLSKYIEKTFSLDPSYSLTFLKCFYMKMYSSRGQSKTFESENYDSIKELIDPDILYNTLHNIYAEILENPTFEDEDDEDVIFLKSFSQIHHWKKKKVNSEVNTV